MKKMIFKSILVCLMFSFNVVGQDEEVEEPKELVSLRKVWSEKVEKADNEYIAGLKKLKAQFESKKDLKNVEIIVAELENIESTTDMTNYKKDLKTDILGEWQASTGNYFIFLPKGAFVFSNREKTQQCDGTWKIKKNKIIVKYTGYTVTFYFNDKDKYILEDAAKTKWELQKIK